MPERLGGGILQRMAQDVFVNQVERVGPGTAASPGAMAPGQAVVLFDPADFVVTNAPDVVVTGPRGESITGATCVARKASAATTFAGSCSTSDSATATALLVVTVPTGFRAWVRITATAEIVSNGHAWAGESRVLLRNPSGTPSLSGGTVSPSGGAIADVDETSGAITGTLIQTPVCTANTATFNVKGPGSYVVKWSATADVLFFAE